VSHRGLAIPHYVHQDVAFDGGCVDIGSSLGGWTHSGVRPCVMCRIFTNVDIVSGLCFPGDCSSCLDMGPRGQSV
jgi:hypothetical protein